MVYHCMEPRCEASFEREAARSCPFCGSRMIRHAMGREIDRLLAGASGPPNMRERDGASPVPLRLEMPIAG